MSTGTTLDRPDTETTIDIDAAFAEIIENEEGVKDDKTGDHDRFSHYVSKEDIIKSSTTGAAVFAICGKKWVPNRNPENFSVCSKCKEVYALMKDQ